MVRGLVIASASALMLASAANAADIYRAPEGGGLKDAPYVPANSWTGFYAGVNGGLASSGTNDVFDLSPVGGVRAEKPSGGFGGGQIGYNWQGLWSPHLVLGLEADIQGAGIDDTIIGSGNLTQSKLDWFGTVRGRLGYAMDGTLLYATGGFAYGGLEKTAFAVLGNLDFRSSGTATGYVIGGGIEQRISPAWSLKGEYQYLNFGKNDLTDPQHGSFASALGAKLHDDDFHTVRVGLSYHFGQDYAGGGGLKDAPYVPANSWTGFYAGVNGGLASSAIDGVFDFGGGEREIKPSGGFGGGQIGYNWQGLWHPHLVLGLEADIQGAGIDDANTSVHTLTEAKLGWFGTVRGRLGYATDGTLLYATGGFAYGGLDKTEFASPPESRDFRSSGTATGYVIGGGIEQRISPAWSLKGEYQYLNFGKNDLTDPRFGSITGSIGGVAKLHDDGFHTVRVGLNYHLGQGDSPLK